MWQECHYQTADARVWPQCHFTSDPESANCTGVFFPTRDYTTDPEFWPEYCHPEPNFTSDSNDWPECHYTSDPGEWPECEEAEWGDLGDAPDSTNHTAGATMTAYPPGGPPGVLAAYPTVFGGPAPPGPKHWNPRADAWLGEWVTLENDADLLPDEDSITNIDPPNDKPDLDLSDDGVLFPVPAPHCVRSVFSYTVTIAAGAPTTERFVNVWFDWTRDGDWDDTPECPDGTLAPEWAVQNQVFTLGPGTYVLQTPAYLPWNPTDTDIPEIWMRISIAEQKAPNIPGTTSLADGRGPVNGYRYGETEDYFFEPGCPPPVADFVWDPTHICTDTVVYFFDTSSSALPILSWSWDFGDSLGYSSLQNPNYTYGVAGTYDVTLSVTNVCGTDTITKSLVVTDCVEQDPDYDIYIKDSDLDDGSVPSSSPWYLSPDIWVRNDGDCTQTDHQNPNPGTTTTVCVRVRNRLATTVDDIDVHVYWANAALGLSWPTSFTPMGTFNIPSLVGGAQHVESLTWSVPYLTAHYCLLARADAPNDPIGSGPDTIVPVDHVPNNNNIAQKNLHVVPFPEIDYCGFFTSTVYTDVVYFDAVNTENAQNTVDIVFDSPDFPLGSGTLMVEPGDLWMEWTTASGFTLDVPNQRLYVDSFPATLDGIEMDPLEIARMTMTIAAEIDERFAVSVTEWSGGSEVGGITYVRDMPFCIYLPVILRDWLP
jgi:PKD repeat protein